MAAMLSVPVLNVSAVSVASVLTMRAVAPPAAPPPPPSPPPPPPDQAKCPETFATPVCAGPTEPCFLDRRCGTADDPHGGLGCNAGGFSKCRFCGFGAFEDITCPAGVGLSSGVAALTGDGSDSSSTGLIIVAIGVVVLCIVMLCVTRWYRKWRRTHASAAEKFSTKKAIKRLSMLTDGQDYPMLNNLKTEDTRLQSRIDWRRVQLEKMLGTGFLGASFVAKLYEDGKGASTGLKPASLASRCMPPAQD